MKINKSIIITVLAVLLSLSSAFNFFMLAVFEIRDMSSFKQVLLCKELLESSNLPSTNKTDDTTTVNKVEETKPSTNNPINTTTSESNKVQTESTVIYSSNDISITYAGQKSDDYFGPALKFYVENNGDSPISVSFTDVYIDGYMAELSSGLCDELAPGRKALVELTLWKSDYEYFTDFPRTAEFVIKLRDPYSWYAIAESELLQIKLK